MIKVTLIALGKLKEKYLKDAVAEYEKRLSGYCSLKTIELTPERLSDKPSEKEIESALKREAQMIRSYIKAKTYKIAMCIEGKMMPSEKLSSLIMQRVNEGLDIAFIIGSSYGLDEDLKKECELKLSMSEMTFPHQLARVMLLEQVYRAFKINEGSAYHK